jgi:hypothetical protein
MIGDRKFGSIVQKFLHEYGEISIDHIEIVAPYEEESNGHPRVRTWRHRPPLRFKMAETQMPANIKNFECLKLKFAIATEKYSANENTINGTFLYLLDTLTFAATMRLMLIISIK